MKKSKKHVESFFNYKQKKYSFYYKPRLNKKHNLKQNTELLEPKSFAVKYIGRTRYIETKSLKSCIRVLKVFGRKEKIKNLRINFFVIPDIVLTKKPKEVRMGKGKGPLLVNRVGILKRGQIIFEVKNILCCKGLVLERVLEVCSSKLPYRVVPIKQY